jgi:high-affinity iron transporter
MLREGLEAALVVAIVLAYLKRLGREDAFGRVWGGTALAGVVALLAGIVVFAAVGNLEGDAEAITEGIVAFLAASVLTWMIFWMARQARFIKGHLHAKIDAALTSGSAVGLAAIAFFAVLREGLESSLFLVSTTVGEHSNVQELLGGLIGLVGAAGIGYLVYKGSRRFNLRLFFRVTGALIILFAAGLVAKGVHEFQEVGLIPTISEHLWNVGSVAVLDPARSWFAELLGSLFGWSPSPSLEMVVVYVLFLVPAGTAFLAQTKKVPTTHVRAETTTAQAVPDPAPQPQGTSV